jgi:hypothetical protein
MATKAAPADDVSGGDPATPATALQDQRATVLKALESLRTRTDLAAKVIGGIGSAALTAVGLAKIGDLFPLPDDAKTRALAMAAVAGFLLMAVAIAALTVSLWKVNRPFFIGTDLANVADLTEAEKVLIQPQWDDFQRVNNATPAEWETLANGHETTATQLETAWAAYFTPKLQGAIERVLQAPDAAADRTKVPTSIPPSPEAIDERRQATTMQSELHLLIARAHLRVVRRRLSDVMSGWSSVSLAGLFVLGLLTFAIGTDYVTSVRKDAVEIAKSCAEAAEAGASSLPKICRGNDEPNTPEETITAAQHEAAAIEALASQYTSCVKDAKKDADELAICQKIRQLIPAG